ncbi:MAG TPA: butyrate kinase [Bacillota bacterium]|nr:butyrate kinase [Bacillota bacterium]
MKILVINPGSTSTKVALFEDEKRITEKKIDHSREELGAFSSIAEELPMRIARVKEFLAENGTVPGGLDVIVARGGMLPPVRHGAYVVDDNLVETLLERPVEHHASNLGAGMAQAIAREGGGKPAFIYDSISVDELTPLARFSGIKGYDRRSFSHVLNTRAIAKAVAEREGFDLMSSNVIVAHLGGGISMNLQSNGDIIDIVSADEGAFSTERAGGIPIYQAARIAREEGADALYAYEIGKGGFTSYLGTNDARVVERDALNGDEKARTILEAMGYQAAKAIGGLATVVRGEVRAIVLTGGMSHIKLLTDTITERVSFIGPVFVMAGELEMEALAAGAYRVMRGEERAALLRG